MTTNKPARPARLPPPHDLEAEECVLGACLLSASAIAAAREIVGPDDFYKPSHAHIFCAICSLDDEGQPADAVTVYDELRRLGRAEQVTRADLLSLGVNVPAISSVGRYAEIVAEQARKRRLVGVGLETVDAASDPTRMSESVVEDVEARLLIAQGDQGRGRGTMRADDAVRLVIERAKAIGLGGDQLAGLPTGHADLDRLLGGMEPGSLVVVGARPSVGKTAFGLGIAVSNATRDTPSLFVSAEMGPVEIGGRLVAMTANVSTDRQRSGHLSESEEQRLGESQARLRNTPLEIFDRAAPSASDVRQAARAMRSRRGLGLIVVDYLQLLTPSATAERRELAVAGIAWGLKTMARDLGCVVIALAQLNRSLEARSDKRPTLADLRESGAIEQHADVVMFIYRDEVYNPQTLDRAVAEVMVAKHRNGPTGMVRLAWLPSLARFASLAPDDAPSKWSVQ